MFNIYKLPTGEWLGVIEQLCISCRYEEYLLHYLQLIFEELEINPQLTFYLNNQEQVWSDSFDRIIFLIPSITAEQKIRHVRKKYHTMKSMKDVLSNLNVQNE